MLVLSMCAAAGILAGCLFGKRQLERWGIGENRRQFYFLILGVLVIFLPGAWLMGLFGYHVWKAIRYWILLYALLLLAILDYRRRIVPNRALLFLAGVRTVLFLPEMLCFPEVWAELAVSSLTGFLGGGLLFLAAGLIARNGLGMGDVKLIAVMGYYLGFRVLMSDMIISLLLAVTAGIFLLAFKRKTLHSELPFVPFLAAGTLITVFLGC